MRTLTLADSLECLIDHRGKTPLKLGTQFVGTGVPVASAQLVREGRLHLDEARFVDAETFRRWMRVHTKRGDVILTSEAPLGRVARVPTDEPLVLGQRLFALRGRPGVLDSGYLYYALQTRQVQAALQGSATGTTVTGIRQSALRKVPVPAPEYSEQLAIAELLSALDDKIAVNMTAVRFAVDLADAQFARAVCGVPLSEQTFADVANVSGGGTPKTSTDEFWSGTVRWATPTDVTALRAPYLASTARTITAAGLAACASSLYPPRSILMTSRATIGAFALAQIPVAVNQGFIVVNAREPVLQYWLFHEMRSRVDEFLSHANGATFLELSRGKFKQLGVRVPDMAAAQEFAGRVGPLHDLAAQLLRETTTLARTRDGLLPLLMSGKVRVRDAERLAEEVL